MAAVLCWGSRLQNGCCKDDVVPKPPCSGVTNWMVKDSFYDPKKHAWRNGLLPL